MARNRLRAPSPSWLVPVAGAVAAAVGALAAGGVSYRYDESVTIGAFVRHDTLAPFTRQIVHNNHPAFSFLEHLAWRVGAESEWAFRVLPALFFAASTALVGRWTIQRWGTLAGATAVVVMVTHPLSVDLARQVRGYSLILLAATAATLLMPRLLDEPGDRSASIGYVASIALGIATHLSMGAVVLGHVGLALSRRASPPWLLRWVAGCSLGAAAYVAIPLTRIRHTFQPSFPADAAWEVLGSTWPSIVALGATTVVFIAAHRDTWLMAGLPTLAIVLIWAVFEPRDLYPRFLVWAVPVVAVGAAWAVSRVRGITVAALAAGVSMAFIAWPVEDSGIRRAANLADAARARGYVVCTIGAEALYAYTTPGREFTGGDQRCDVLLSIGSWRPAGYEQTRAALPHHARFGDVPVAADFDISAVLHAPG